MGHAMPLSSASRRVHSKMTNKVLNFEGEHLKHDCMIDASCRVESCLFKMLGKEGAIIPAHVHISCTEGIATYTNLNGTSTCIAKKSVK